jgi:hypothetical protein
VTAALPPEAAGKPVEVWFTDEARVGQQGTLTRVWAKRGPRPRAPRDRRYDWAYLFGAVCPERSTGAAVIMPEVNIEAMNVHSPRSADASRWAPSPCWYWTVPAGTAHRGSMCPTTSCCFRFRRTRLN